MMFIQLLSIVMQQSNEKRTERQDSGVPEDVPSPGGDSRQPTECEEIDIVDTIQGTDKKDAFSTEGKDSKDGSDSGVEGCAVEVPTDFEGSCDALNESNASCDSSLVSCCSVYEDPCAILPDDLRLMTGGEGTSEGGSESSSIAGSVSARASRLTPKKSGAASATSSVPGKKKTGSSAESQKGARAKPAFGSANAKPARTILGRAKSREKHQSLGADNAPTASTPSAANNARGTSSFRSATATSAAKSRIRNLPDSLPSPLTTEIGKDLAQKGRLSSVPRTSWNSRVHNLTSTPNESDRSKGRSLTYKHESPNYKFDSPKTRFMNRDLMANDKMSLSLDSKSVNAYITLPRKPRTKVPIKSTDQTDKTLYRSRSGSRDASLSRSFGRKSGSLSSKESLGSRTLPPHAKLKTERTRIYHETSVQTRITSTDLDNIIAGKCTFLPNPESIERANNCSQTEGTWEEFQTLKKDCKRATDEAMQSKRENEKLKAELAETKRRLEEEQSDHAFAKQELEKNAQRVMAMLGTPLSEQIEGSDSFLELETHLQSSGQVVANQQVQIADLQSLCRMLKRGLEKSLAAQKSLLQQQQEQEAESLELQDFLQAEKSTLSDALKEAEIEILNIGETLNLVQSELERKTEECKHLVRISEQRRQENLSLNMKLNAIERKSQELLLAQGATVSGAAVALSGLGNRLEALVEQLISSYNISEKDLEEMVYHNEAYSRSNSSIESSPVSSKQSLKDCTPSPKRGSFVLAVLGAIKNAATHPFAIKTNDKIIKQSSQQIQKELSTESSSELLDFETEPCLMMESVLEDVSLPDTYSHNMISSSDSLRRALSVPESVDESILKSTKQIDEYNSLSNLSQAILHRRKVEDEEEDNCESISESETGPTDSLAPLSDYCQSIGLVDQVIDVDNLVTKLLKVLRIIQLDNDICIQDLREQKYELEMKLDNNLGEINDVHKNITNSNGESSCISIESKKNINERNLMKDVNEDAVQLDVTIDQTSNGQNIQNENHNENQIELLTTRSCS